MNTREFRNFRNDHPQTPYDAAVYLSDAYHHLRNRDASGYETLDAREILVLKGMEASYGSIDDTIATIREGIHAAR